MMTIQTVLLSESKQSSELVNQVLADSEYQLVFEASCLTELMTASVSDIELIILSISSPNDQLISQLKLVNEQYPLPVVIFTESDGSDAIETAIQAGVSAYVVDGLSENRVLPILRTALARFKQNLSMQKELVQLRTSLADRKIIDRAKGIIMDQRQCTEQQAYNLLRKQAMDQNMKLAVLSQTVVSASELLSPIVNETTKSVMAK